MYSNEMRRNRDSSLAASDGGGDAVMVRWLQSAGLQHLAAPLAAAALDHRLLPSLLMQVPLTFTISIHLVPFITFLAYN